MTPVLVHDCGGKVGYDSDELSGAAHQARMTAGVGTGRDVAAAKVDGLNGRHAEQDTMNQFDEQGVQPLARQDDQSGRLGMTKGSPATTSSEMRQARLDVSRRVTNVLRTAGLTVSSVDDDETTAGVVVETDLGADQAGGVYLRWDSSSQMFDAVADAISASRFDDPLFVKDAAISQAMLTAIAAVLSLDNIETRVCTDDLRPSQIQVVESGTGK